MIATTPTQLKEMLKTQANVNEIIGKKLTTQPTASSYVLAYTVELYEFINAVGTWKWWKHSHVVSRERVLDELADCYAFLLSAMNTIPEDADSIDKEGQKIVIHPREDMINAYCTNLIETQESIAKELTTVNDLLLSLGTQSEGGDVNPIPTILTFIIANIIADKVLENLTMEEIIAAYNKKSQENIDRQERNY